jgi:hypothetical protein
MARNSSALEGFTLIYFCGDVNMGTQHEEYTLTSKYTLCPSIDGIMGRCPVSIAWIISSQLSSRVRMASYRTVEIVADMRRMDESISENNMLM